MTPSQVLPIATVIAGATGTANQGDFVTIDDKVGELWAGTIWAPKFVALRLDITGSPTNVRMVVHLRYEVVEVPWMDWFLMWETLDGVVDGTREW